MLLAETQPSALPPLVGGKPPSVATVLVTGAGGLLGSALCARLAREGLRVVPHTRSGAAGFPLEDVARIGPAVQATQPDWIIHAAGNTNLDACEADPASAQRLHVEASAELARAAAREGCRLLYVSTDSVYDGDVSGAHAEDSAVRPLNHYARTKLAGEQACLAVLDTTIVARVNFFGLHPLRHQGLASWLTGNLRAGRCVNGFTDVWFNPLGNHELAALLAEVVWRNLAGGIYNFGASDACSKFDFARRLAVRLGADSELIRPALLAEAGLATPRPRNTVMATSKLSAVLGCEMPALDACLDRLLAA